MKIGIIINGISRKKKFFYADILPTLQKEFGVTVFETKYPQHAVELAAQHQSSFDVMLAAGGDGTLNQVLNGILTSHPPHAVLGVIPLGTGNDFAGMCKLSANGTTIASMLRSRSFKATDIGRIDCHTPQGKPHTKYFVNVCSLGMGPEVVKRLAISNRRWGPTLTYLSAITTTFFSHQPQSVHVKTNTWSWGGRARVVAIANGISFGNRLYIAPDAKPDDGLFSTFIASDVPLAKFLWYLQSIKTGKRLADRKIHYQQATEVELLAHDKTAIEAEGEIQGYLPATVSVLPKHIQVLR